MTLYEEFVYSQIMLSSFEAAENAYSQFRTGLFGAEEIETVRQQLSRIFEIERNQVYYEAYKPMLTPDFIGFVDSIYEAAQ